MQGHDQDRILERIVGRQFANNLKSFIQGKRLVIPDGTQYLIQIHQAIFIEKFAAFIRISFQGHTIGNTCIVKDGELEIVHKSPLELRVV